MRHRSAASVIALGFASVAVTLATGCLHVDRPAVLEVVPSEGQVGTEITIHGSNFVDDFSQTRIFFAGLAAASVNVLSITPTEIHVKVPNGAVTGDVVVSVGGVESGRAPFTVFGPWLLTGTADRDGLTVFDTHTGLVSAVLPTSAPPVAGRFAPSGAFAWFLGEDGEGGFLSQFDSDTRDTAERVALADGPTALDFDPIPPAVDGLDSLRSEAWVAHHDSGTVEVVESSTPKVRTTFSAGTQVSAVELTPDGKVALILEPNAPAVALYDADAAEPSSLATLGLGANPGPLLVDDLTGKAFVLERSDHRVAFIDPGTREITDRLVIGTDPVDMIRSGSTLFVLSRASRTIDVVDSVGKTLVTTIQMGNVGEPSLLAALVTTTESLIWAVTGGNQLHGYDQLDQTEKKVIDVDPGIVAFRPLVGSTGFFLLLAHDVGTGEVTVIDQPDTRLRKTTLNGHPTLFALQP